jgi:hypothetical protein
LLFCYALNEVREIVTSYCAVRPAGGNPCTLRAGPPSLQKLMLRSRASTLVSVRQVTQRNAGRKTAGIDGEVALTPEARAGVAVRVHQSRSSWRPRAVKRAGGWFEYAGRCRPGFAARPRG